MNLATDASALTRALDVPDAAHLVAEASERVRVEVAGETVDVPVIAVNTVIVGTGSAGYCAADRLVLSGQRDILMVTDKIRAGSSRNAGSDKQTYYKLTLGGGGTDSVREMAETLFSGGAMDGDVALAEAALSARCFVRLSDVGVPFPTTNCGEVVGYKTDHDPRQRATSVGPYTSRTMTNRLENQVVNAGIPVLDDCRVIDLVVDHEGGDGPDEGRDGTVVGVLLLRKVRVSEQEPQFLLVRATNVVYATGGPAGMYAISVFPHGQWGATGAALRAGAVGKNLTEWQFGLASTNPRWNVSGTYMQVVPRFVSTDGDGGDEREFLSDAIGDLGRMMTMVFLKGYQWPFDVRKAAAGSSLVDLLVYQETVLRGRRVFLDFRSNAGGGAFDASLLSDEARDYLDKAGVTALGADSTPIQRLQHMNRPAYDFYLDRNPGVDLETDMLEVAVCAQHNNGGIMVDHWWHASLSGLFPVGEAAGAHGIYRPGGAALNSGQVGATRAAQFIAATRDQEPVDEDTFSELAAPLVREAATLLADAGRRHANGADDITGTTLTRISEQMSRDASFVRSREGVEQALADISETLRAWPDTVAGDATSRRSVDRIFLVRDILTSQYVYLSAMLDYLDHGGQSRGSVLYTDPEGTLPVDVAGPDPRDLQGGDSELDLPEVFRHALDGGAFDGVAQEARWSGLAGDAPVFTWRDVRPIPAEAEVFETVWRSYRETGNLD